jgi:alanyl-tRNA synthetase
MKKRSTNEIRTIWLEFFREHGHNVEDSASLIPNNDPTLLWINAGVAPLKRYFDGSVVPKNPRIVNAQKCIRTNDIENVGKTARHHTFFEMLGNFSIGDYFREEAIRLAAILLLDDRYFGFDKNRLFITYYPDDIDTYNAWIQQGISEDHLIPTENNFWEIGEGPCGPDTEIFFDRGNEYGPEDLNLIKNDIENDRYIEIWNIVFSQFNAKKGMKREDYPELPSKNIDTGMGLERMACVIQDVPTNFETDTFRMIMDGIERYAKDKYTGQMSYKVIADHLRTVTFAVSDGAVLSNEGRGYVLRRLLRRAVKHGKKLGIEQPFLHLLVDDVIKAMGEFYKYLYDTEEIVKEVIKKEEEKFFETLAQGEKILENIIAESTTKTISGKEAFTLYDTYGFPFELTEELALEAGFIVEKEEFLKEMEAQKERARSARKSLGSMGAQNIEYLSFKEKDCFTGYHSLKETTKVLKAFHDGVVLFKTPFYAESGGQVGDKGVLIHNSKNYVVQDVQKLPNGQFLHMIPNHDLKDGDLVEAIVDEKKRKLTMYNHSATHLLFAALREFVGDHVSQQGSNVSDYGMRFDFNNYNSLDDETMLKLEQKVNEIISENIPVKIEEMSIEEAKSLGAIAEFGEKYGDKVRVVDMKYTIDLCGGTHVKNTGDIQKFAIASIENKGSGIYRITGHASESISHIKDHLTGFNLEIDKLIKKANKIVKEAKNKGIDLEFHFKKNEELKGSYQDVIDKRVEFKTLTDMVKDLDKLYQEKTKEMAIANIDAYLEQKQPGGIVIKTQDLDGSSLRPLADRLMDHLNEGVVFIANVSNNKVTFVVKSKSKDYHAGQLAKKAAIICGGNGGGRPDMAQAGGKDITKVDEALDVIKKEIK